MYHATKKKKKKISSKSSTNIATWKYLKFPCQLRGTHHLTIFEKHLLTTKLLRKLISLVFFYDSFVKAALSNMLMLPFLVCNLRNLMRSKIFNLNEFVDNFNVKDNNYTWIITILLPWSVQTLHFWIKIITTKWHLV